MANFQQRHAKSVFPDPKNKVKPTKQLPIATAAAPQSIDVRLIAVAGSFRWPLNSAKTVGNQGIVASPTGRD